MNTEKCQSCRLRNVDVVDPQDNPDFPYLLCRGCHERLLGRCLRPLEYFNVKALHGETYLLNEDFYDDDGTSEQPEYPVFDDHRLAFPKLREDTNDLEHLVDHSIVSFLLKDKIIELLRNVPKDQLLGSLDRRLKDNQNNAYRIFEVVAMVLGPFASQWVRTTVVDGFSHDEEDETISTYSKMLALCLPDGEGYDFCVEVLNTVSTSKKLNGEVHNLIYFQDERALDWVEANIHRMGTLYSSWGLVAAASKLSWERVVRWLDRGRPISLVALDGLYACSVTGDTSGAAPWFRQNPVRLLRPATIEEMNCVLREYLEKDNVPRTRNQIEFVTLNWDRILKTEQ
jgi:hypothetical protein